jgi:hypothetical protein
MVIQTNGMGQTFAATTNGTSGTQTFGITSGTSNCTSDGVVAANRQREAFAEASLPHLLRDMAVGRGEYLAGLGILYGCSREALPLFAQAAQRSFKEICEGKSCAGNAGDFLTAVESKLGKDAGLVKSCPKLAAVVPAPAKNLKLAAKTR